MIATQPFPYLMESPNEGRRLETKTVRETAIRQLEIAGLREGMRCLDVGCGTGAVTRLMAEIAGPDLAYGLDASRQRVEEARRIATAQGVKASFTEARADRIEALDGGFDFTWSRFLFEYLDQPRAALEEMIRVTTEGGIVAAADLDAQLEHFHGLSPEAEQCLEEIRAELERSHFDRRVGRKLYGWFREAGLRNIRVQVMPHQIFAGGLPPRELANWRQKLEIIVPRMIERSGDSQRWKQAHEMLLEQLEDPRLFYYSTLILVSGKVPHGATGNR